MNLSPKSTICRKKNKENLLPKENGKKCQSCDIFRGQSFYKKNMVKIQNIAQIMTKIILPNIWYYQTPIAICI
jgi:hypothetical protein